ncbi:hypothetical protein CN198_21270 [Sinorhizobium meliloti]|uniref:putative phage abortive infection protein n=1 Tax=Rhizobium meliloti TaxID=382 RepID=UPI000FDAF54F|nr:putative phage abortive infection protein [Sinorhizobium meliloti]RVH65396.1 hypothetical protein CN198_21270 [Sinorhizobium meliloti]RVK37639.1 hypothetical protein CN163_16030 [Sinorhizobium meliloti]RVK62800.1 hypothetical protein CN159_30380 [Sinorhizobium meliloti]
MSRFWIWAAGLLLLSIWLVWVGQRWIFPELGYHWNPERLGQWGDTFGALNALFAAAGFSAVLITLWFQQRQIESAQNEQHRQRFESSYFELLRLRREARDAIKFRHSKEYNEAKKLRYGPLMTFEGQDAFRAGMVEIRHWLQVSESKGAGKTELAELYRAKIHSRYESKLGPYFRLMYTILQRISEDPVLSEAEKIRYGNLLRSQITSHEAAMAGLNGLSPVSKDFSRLVTEFRLLKYLPNGKMRRTLEAHYPPEAFKERD